MSYKLVTCAIIKCDHCGKVESVDHDRLFDSSMDGMGSRKSIDPNWYLTNGWVRLKREPLDFCSKECEQLWKDEL